MTIVSSRPVTSKERSRGGEGIFRSPRWSLGEAGFVRNDTRGKLSKNTKEIGEIGSVHLIITHMQYRRYNLFQHFTCVLH